MTKKITVVGSLNMDFSVQAPNFPDAGETILGENFKMSPGGKGGNQAVAAALLGSNVRMVARIGDDTFGHQLHCSLISHSVDCEYVTWDKKVQTGISMIVVEKSGVNRIVVDPGANMQLLPRDIEDARDAIVGSDVLLLQLEIPIPTVMHAANIANTNGVTVILNPAPALKLSADLIELVDLIIPNENEAAVLSGMSVKIGDNLLEAADRICQKEDQTVVFTMGKDGAVLIKNGNILECPGFCVESIDTTAAGDAFIGGLASSLAKGESIEDAVLWGNAAGALATTKVGAQASLPDLQEVQRLLVSRRY